MRRSNLFGIATVGLATALVVLPSRNARADVVIDWNNVLLQAVRTASTAPPLAARNMAMTQVAVYNAVNAIDASEGFQSYNPYGFNQNAVAGTSRNAAAAQAAYTVLKSLYPTQTATFDTALANSLATIPDGAAKTQGIALGTAAGNSMISLRTGDGSVNTLPPYTGGTGVGQWRPTPPANANGVLPNFGSVTPFALASGTQFRPSAPPVVGSAEYNTALAEVQSYGSATGSLRTTDQTNIALFWSDTAGTATPIGHWNRIAQTIGQQVGNTVSQNARMFALMDIGMADAGITCWEAKYTYSYWRPITAIQTTSNPTWTSLLTTPAFPSYVSGHSTFSMTAATILGGYLGTDSITFTSSSEGFSVPDRTYTSLIAAADEAGQSRIYGGIHFQFDNQQGLALGQNVGSYVLANALAANPAPEAGTAVLSLIGLTAFGVYRSGMRRKRN